MLVSYVFFPNILLTYLNLDDISSNFIFLRIKKSNRHRIPADFCWVRGIQSNIVACVRNKNVRGFIEILNGDVGSRGLDVADLEAEGAISVDSRSCLAKDVQVYGGHFGGFISSLAICNFKPVSFYFDLYFDINHVPWVVDFDFHLF